MFPVTVHTQVADLNLKIDEFKDLEGLKFKSLASRKLKIKMMVNILETANVERNDENLSIWYM